MSLSDFKSYIKEREGKEVLETEKGFVVYGINCLDLPRPHIYIQDIYIRPEFRRQRVSYELSDRLGAAAKKHGCEILVSSLDISAVGADISLRALIGYDLKLLSADRNAIYMFKEL